MVKIIPIKRYKIDGEYDVTIGEYVVDDDTGKVYMVKDENGRCKKAKIRLNEIDERLPEIEVSEFDFDKEMEFGDVVIIPRNDNGILRLEIKEEKRPVRNEVKRYVVMIR